MAKNTAVVETIGSEILYARSEPVGEVTPYHRVLARLMLDVVTAMDGLGIAAPQVGKNIRMITLNLTDPHRERPDSPGEMLLVPKLPATFINPEIIEYSDETVTADEGCLSVPDLFAPVTRPARIVFRGTVLDGETVEYECAGMLARLIQHETDHLNGICFVDRLTAEVKKQFSRELNAVKRSSAKNKFKKIVII